MPRNATVLICAVASLSVKYQCPLDARVKPDTSPTTHTDGNFASTAPRTCAVSCETVSVTGAASWGAALIRVGDSLRESSFLKEHRRKSRSLAERVTYSSHEVNRVALLIVHTA